MNSLPCIKRQTVAVYNKDGSKGELHRCSHQSCSHYNQTVDSEICAACPLRVFTHQIRPEGYKDGPVGSREYAQPKLIDGKLVYEKIDAKPPSVPDGYERSDDPWVFLPLMAPCSDREMANTVQSCGCIKMNAFCGSKESNRYMLTVAASDCSACPARRAP